MIDPVDKLTQALPLDEQPAKRKRGRPATGKAMTPAEKQRAYRERQKAKSGYVDPATVEEIKRMQAEITSLRDALVATDAAGLKKIDELRAENEKLKKQLSSRDDNELMKRVELAEARADAMGNELAIVKAQLSNPARKKRHRDDPPVDIKEWALQRQSPKGQWRTVAKYDTAAEANIALADQAGAMGHLYRVKAPK